jgi:hypothetical protein
MPASRKSFSKLRMEPAKFKADKPKLPDKHKAVCDTAKLKTRFKVIGFNDEAKAAISALSSDGSDILEVLRRIDDKMVTVSL